jgi:uncharacterized membrane protein YeaQ/YmgE (transglycosylase-associated protein family)
MSIIAAIIIGLIVGALAKAIMPGKDPGGIIVTILIGIVGSIIGHFIAAAIYPAEAGPGFIMRLVLAVIGALILLGGYRLITGRSARAEIDLPQLEISHKRRRGSRVPMRAVPPLLSFSTPVRPPSPPYLAVP